MHSQHYMYITPLGPRILHQPFRELRAENELELSVRSSHQHCSIALFAVFMV